MYSLHSIVVRTFHLYASFGSRSTSQTVFTPRPSSALKPWALTCLVVYVGHVTYLSILPRFDYSYNMAFNLTLGLIHNVLWSLYALPSSRSLLPRFPFRPKNY